MEKRAETKEEEGQYRRGYRDGYLAAVEDMCVLMMRETRGKAHTKCIAHWEGALYRWVEGLGGWFPPRLVK